MLLADISPPEVFSLARQPEWGQTLLQGEMHLTQTQTKSQNLSLLTSEKIKGNPRDGALRENKSIRTGFNYYLHQQMVSATLNKVRDFRNSGSRDCGGLGPGGGNCCTLRAFEGLSLLLQFLGKVKMPLMYRNKFY